MTTSAGEPGIVVGVSGSRGSVRALRWAAGEARRRGLRLRAVLAWEEARPARYSRAAGCSDRKREERNARQTLDVALRSVFGRELPFDVIACLREGVPERVLVSESAGAGLLVLGSTLATSSSAPLIGPVVRGCLHQARCPVVIVGPGARDGHATGSDLGDRYPVPGQADLADAGPGFADDQEDRLDDRVAMAVS